MSKLSLDKVMKSLESVVPVRVPFSERNRPLTLWIPKEYQSRYDGLQKKTKKRFAKVLCELIISAIDHADAA